MKLPPKDAAHVLKLLCALDEYGAHHFQLDPPQGGSASALAARLQVRSALREQPEVIERYLNDNPDHLDPSDLELIRSWKDRPRERYMVVKHLKSGSVLAAGGQHYLVSGLMDSLAALLSRNPLPTMLEAVLLPYRDVITTDGIFNTFPIGFGADMRRSIQSDYTRARRRGEIISSFRATPRPVVSSSQSHPHRDAVQAVAKTVEKLRGGDGQPLPSAGLGLLRWSAKLASSCLESEPDHAAIRKQMSQLRKFYNQLGEAMDLDS